MIPIKSPYQNHFGPTYELLERYPNSSVLATSHSHPRNSFLSGGDRNFSAAYQIPINLVMPNGYTFEYKHGANYNPDGELDSTIPQGDIQLMRDCFGGNRK